MVASIKYPTTSLEEGKRGEGNDVNSSLRLWPCADSLEPI